MYLGKHPRTELRLRGWGNEGKPAKETRDNLKKETQKNAWSLRHLDKDIFQGRREIYSAECYEKHK